MRLTSSFFCSSSLERFVKSSADVRVDINSQGEEEYSIDIESMIDALREFFSIFQTNDKKGRKLLDVLCEEWNLITFDAQKDDKISYFNEMMHVIGNDLNADSLVIYQNDYLKKVKEWNAIKQSFERDRRYFPDIDITDKDWDSLLCVNDVIEAGTKLYRGRIQEKTSFSMHEMGMPPEDKAVDGRANPHGIPFLYLCKERDTTLYEVRALNPDVVSVATFEATEDIEIVNFDIQIDPFDDLENIGLAVQRHLLLRKISEDMSKPIHRHMRRKNYVPTQYICEFIRHKVQAKGVQFKSSLKSDGHNVVLFSESGVTCIGEPEQITISKLELTYSSEN